MIYEHKYHQVTLTINPEKVIKQIDPQYISALFLEIDTIFETRKIEVKNSLIQYLTDMVLEAQK